MLLPHSMLGWALVEKLAHNTVAMYHDSLNAMQSYRADKALSMDKLWKCLSLYMDYCATQATACAECVESAAVDQAADESTAADQAADESADAAAESAEQDKPDAEQPAAEADNAAAEEMASAEAGDAESAEAEAVLTPDAAAEEVASAGTDTQQVDSSLTLPCCSTYDTQLHMPQLYHSSQSQHAWKDNQCTGMTHRS